MFAFLGRLIARYWLITIGCWVVLVALAWWYAPAWDTVTRSGEVGFLPEKFPSRRGDQFYREAFPLQYSGSNVALVLWREAAEIRDEDKDFIQKDLVDSLGELALGENETSPITTIRTLAEEGVGALLVSPDRKATLVLVELSTGFQEQRNIQVVGAIESLFAKLRNEGKVPVGLEFAITGSATAGRDVDVAEGASVEAIELWTIAVVVALLLLLYRAPLVAVIPLATVFMAVTLALSFLAILAQAGIFTPSRDLRVFVTVLAYGAGVDYCLFLIARYREELGSGATPREAVASAIGKVGTAILASAATVIIGIGMLAFAQFGKIHEAGLVIPFALTITLLGTLTFTPALLRFTGHCAFWPRCVEKKPTTDNSSNYLQHALDEGIMPNIWVRLGPALLRHPGAIWLGTTLAMMPFAVLGVVHYHETNYNVVSDLPAHAPSAVGNRVLAKHFPLGALGPVTVLLHNDEVDFTDKEGMAQVDLLAENLRPRMDELNLADVRSIAQPLGVSDAAKKVLARYRLEKDEFEETLIRRARGYYVSDAGKLAGHVTRLDIMLVNDPLSQQGIADLVRLEKTLPNALPDKLRGSQVYLVGSTAVLRDLSEVKRADQHLIQILVSVAVLVLLIILLRRLVVSIYLIVSVLFSYLATLGLTYLVFSMVYGSDFGGLDWKVPIFLFTILVAVGEDYNIFLLTRIKEERHHHGPLAAIPIALGQTGKVISSCGFIMAGTFASLLSGSLRALLELGFALSVGVLIDTLVVRPILVPSFLVLLQRFIPGRLGRFMALGKHESEKVAIG